MLNRWFYHFFRRASTNFDPAAGPQARDEYHMALLGALAATGSRRQGCVLRVAADAITFYCGGDVVSGGGDSGGSDSGSRGGDGAVEYYTATAASGRLSASVDRFGDYFRRLVRSVAIEDGGSGAGGYYYGAENDSSAAAVLANATAGVEPFLNGSYNHTLGTEVEDLTNYIFVISIGIILGAMILTTICGKSIDVIAVCALVYNHITPKYISMSNLHNIR